MSVIFDNLTAIVVGSVLLAAFVGLQVRGSEKGLEAAERYRAEALVDEMARVFERELENVRSRPETERVFAPEPAGPTMGDDAYRFRLRRATTADGTEYTAQASFPTLLDPDALTQSPIGILTYHVEETDERVTIDGEQRTLLRVTRYVYPRGGPVRNTATFERLVGFDVVALGANGAEIREADEVPGQPTRLRLSIEVAPRLPGGAELQTAITHGRTIRLASAASLVGAAPIDRTVPGGIPGLPGDPGVTPPEREDGGGSGPSDVPVYNDGGDYVICHDPSDRADTKEIGAATVSNHLAHGDHLGPCSGAG